MIVCVCACARVLLCAVRRRCYAYSHGTIIHSLFLFCSFFSRIPIVEAICYNGEREMLHNNDLPFSVTNSHIQLTTSRLSSMHNNET